MANSKYEHVKIYEKHDTLLPSTYIVVRIDGRGFHKLSKKYGFIKPNDRYALNLMNATAQAVMKDLPHITMAYGISDEFSFVFGRSCDLFERRERCVDRVISPLDSIENVPYIFDSHINNLYNTTFWAMVQKGGMSTTEAEAELKGTLAANKNEILFSRYGINYNNEPEIFKKGTIIYREHENVNNPPVKEGSSIASEDGEEDSSYGIVGSKTHKERERKLRMKAAIVTEHVDLINDKFWLMKPWLLSGKPVQ